MKKMITVLGLGFVGLTTALGFAEKDNLVYGYDVDIEKTNIIAKGEIPFVEPMLKEMLEKHLDVNFIISKNIVEGIKLSEYIFICVGTPVSEDGSADLKYIYSALDYIIDNVKDEKHRIIVIKSTVPPSTTKEKIIPYFEEKIKLDSYKFSIVNNPEFLREGKCWEDFMNADRIICGVRDKNEENMMKNLYKNFEAPFCSVTLNTAEFIKYLSNTMLATMISFSNEMSIIGDNIGGIDIKKSFEILHMDKRWGDCNMKSYVYPGCGYGGYCLPKDTKAMFIEANLKGYRPKILENVIETNEKMAAYVSGKIKNQSSKDSRISILGLSFKPDSDDVRESQAAKIIKNLSEAGFLNIIAYDPISIDQFKKFYDFKFIDFVNNLELACENSDIIVIVTAWDEFINIKDNYPGKKVIDLRYFI